MKTKLELLYTPSNPDVTLSTNITGFAQQQIQTVPSNEAYAQNVLNAVSLWYIKEPFWIITSNCLLKMDIKTSNADLIYFWLSNLDLYFEFESTAFDH